VSKTHRLAKASTPPADAVWRWPLDPDAYDRTPRLRREEKAALEEVERRRKRGTRPGAWPAWTCRRLERLRRPVEDALKLAASSDECRREVHYQLQRGMHRYQLPFWAWTREQWLDALRLDRRQHSHAVLTVAYLLCGFTDLHLSVRPLKRRDLAVMVFGAAPVATAVTRVQKELRHWGYQDWLIERQIPHAVATVLLVSSSPRLEDITEEVVVRLLRERLPHHIALGVRLVLRCLAKMELLAPSAVQAVIPHTGNGPVPLRLPDDVPAEWAHWCLRWRDTSTVTPAVRNGRYHYLLRTGRWLAAHHPEITAPHQWTRDLAAEFVAALDRMKVGDWCRPRAIQSTTAIGRPLSASSKDQHLAALRAFFRDGQEWGWFRRRFDPVRVFATPRSVKALLGPKPRVIADDVWAKLLWAGLNLTEEDLPSLYSTRGTPYPLTMIRALVVTWLFAGLRADELRRLRVGCVRWQRQEVVIPGSTEVLPKDAVCWLDVPTNKTGTSFTKAVDRIVGEGNLAWEGERPTQLPSLDPKTGETVQFPFSYRGRRVAVDYLNSRLIPSLCRKAGVPAQDARGNITSHRARSTIASQLANAKEPMSLLGLMEWLGHGHPAATMHYVKVAPTRLAKAYADAGYFARNLRAIEVLTDQDAIESGAAAGGAPWRFYDLGHGYCTYKFFDQCPHRMACAKCSFYRPKGSSQAQLLEGKANLLRFRQEIPLLETEQAAVDDGIEAMERLLGQLADVPTPDGGPSPRQRGLRQPPVSPP